MCSELLAYRFNMLFLEEISYQTLSCIVQLGQKWQLKPLKCKIFGQFILTNQTLWGQPCYEEKKLFCGILWKRVLTVHFCRKCELHCSTVRLSVSLWFRYFTQNYNHTRGEVRKLRKFTNRSSGNLEYLHYSMLVVSIYVEICLCGPK